MRITKKEMILFIIVILVVVLGVWRIWPHSLSKVLSADMMSIVSFEGAVTNIGFIYGDGVTPYTEQYKLTALPGEEEHI